MLFSATFVPEHAPESLHLPHGGGVKRAMSGHLSPTEVSKDWGETTFILRAVANIPFRPTSFSGGQLFTLFLMLDAGPILAFNS